MAASATRMRWPRLALALVVAEGFLGRLTFGMVSFALPLYALSLGLSLVEVGAVVGLRTVVALLLKPVAGHLADRVGVRRVYLAGTGARALAAAALLAVDGPAGLLAVRLLQGASAAGRDVASLGVIAREAAGRIGTSYGLYASAKHVGGVAGAAVAGLVIAAGRGYEPLFLLVLVLSVLPVGAAWLALQQAPEAPLGAGSGPAPPQDEGVTPNPARRQDAIALARELGGPALVGLLAATAAYMVHGLFPVLATQHAGLSAAETGLIFGLSALVFLVAGPACGWLVDRFGHAAGLAWRSGANVGSSVLYVASPTLAGLAAARSLDDSGKAAFRPAWATLVAGVADADPPRRGQRLGLLDAAQTAGEALGPVLAGALWQAGGVPALFGGRIAVAVVAELAVLYLVHRHPRPPEQVRAGPAGEPGSVIPAPSPREAWAAVTGLLRALPRPATAYRQEVATTDGYDGQGQLAPVLSEVSGPCGGNGIVSVTAHLDRSELEALDTLVAAGFATNRADAVRWALGRVRRRPAYQELRQRLRDIERLENEF